MIGGRNWLVDDWHRAQAAALHSLAKEHGGPIAPSQLADALQVSVDDLTPVALVKNGHAFFRGPRGSSRMLWPREGTAPRLVHAVAAFRRLRQGVTLAWREPRRTGSRKFIRRRMTISRTLRSRVQSALRVGMRHIGLDHLRHAEQHHLRLLLDAVWEESMSRSNLPRELWQAKGDVAARARHTADNRRSELMQFLSWAEHEGFVSLHDLQSITLPESWTRFVLRAEGAPGQLDVVARRLAKIAFTRLHLPSPERLVDRGFARSRTRSSTADRTDQMDPHAQHCRSCAGPGTTAPLLQNPRILSGRQTSMVERQRDCRTEVCNCPGGRPVPSSQGVHHCLMRQVLRDRSSKRRT